MADRDENNRRKLPRVGSGDPQAKKDIAENKNQIKEQEVRLTDLTSRFVKTEAQARKAEQDAGKAQTTADQANKTALSAQKSAKSALSKSKALEKDSKSKVSARVFQGLQSSFNVSNKGFTNSISGIKQSINSSALSFQTRNQTVDQKLEDVKGQIAVINNGLVLDKSQAQTNIAGLNKNLAKTQINNLALSEMMKEHFAKQEKRASSLEKSARLNAATQRKKQREKLLEGGFKAAAKAGRTINKTANSLLGGFNLINALKGVLGNLLLGIGIMNFSSIYSWAEDNIDKIRRFFILWGKKVLNPVKKFFGALIDFSFKALKWTGKVIGGIKSLISEALGFTTKVATKLIDGLKSVVRWFTRARTASQTPSPSPTRQPTPDTSGGKVPATGGDAVTPRGTSNTPGKAPGGSPGGSPDGRAIPSPNAPSGTGGKPPAGGRAPRTGQRNIFQRIQDAFTNIVDKISSQIKGIQNKIGAAIKKGPEALKSAYQSSRGAFKGIGESLDTSLAKLGGKKLLRIPWFRSFLENGLATNPILTFPIDFLLNRFIGDMTPEQAAGRAFFSTAGTFIGGGLAASQPWLAPITAFAGGEIGDFVGARIMGMPTDSTTLGIAGELFDKWWNGEGNKETTDGNSTALTPAVGASKASGLIAGTSSIMGSFSGASSTASPGAAQISSQTSSLANVPPNQVLRRPIKSSGAGGNKMTTINMPPEAVQLPTEVIGGKNNGPSTIKSDAQPIPNISSSNPAMGFMDTLAASIFEVALV